MQKIGVLLVVVLWVGLIGCTITNKYCPQAGGNTTLPFTFGAQQESKVEIKSPTVAEEIRELKKLAEEGVITEEEFKKAKE
ncbi:MAG: SHOCT domain-containing protein [bacterium]|nr:SHOCT domain-containing protein [bacterium]